MVVLVILSLGVDPLWSHVDALIADFDGLPNVSFTAGDSRGRMHAYEKGASSLQMPQFLASASKFPAAVAIAGAVAEGHFTFDSLAADVFSPWWTTATDDPRSQVTLHHLLTFTSGLVLESPDGGDVPCLAFNASKVPSEECAKQIYSSGHWQSAPGSIWSYHSLHLQLAGAMAAKACGVTIPALLDKYLLKRLNLTHSFWATDLSHPGPSADPNPHLAATMISTGDDYEKILQAVLTYSILPKAVLDVMEEDCYRYYPSLQAANNTKDTSLLFYGHYSMGLYYECPIFKLDGTGGWDESCYEAARHADPGAFGYWPLIDRRRGYYMQIVVTYFDALPAWAMLLPPIQATVAMLPGQCESELRYRVSPWVEAALGMANISVDPLYKLPAPIELECALATPTSIFQ